MAAYPLEVLDNPKRMKEWDNAHKGGRIGPRARSREQHQALLRYKYFCEDNGLDICHLIICHAQSDIAASDKIQPIKKAEATIINLQQQNTFISQVVRPRRVADPGLLSMAKRDISGTTYRLAFESLVILKALQMQHSLCFRDFPEIRHNHFKKVILRLKRKGLVAPIEPRTCPRFYRLTPKLLMSLVVREY